MSEMCLICINNGAYTTNWVSFVHMEVIYLLVQYLCLFKKPAGSICNSTHDCIIPAGLSCMEVHRGHGSTTTSPLSLPKFLIFSRGCWLCVFCTSRRSSLTITDFNESDRSKQYGGNLSHPLVLCSRLWGERSCQLLRAFVSRIDF